MPRLAAALPLPRSLPPACVAPNTHLQTLSTFHLFVFLCNFNLQELVLLPIRESSVLTRLSSMYLGIRGASPSLVPEPAASVDEGRDRPGVPPPTAVVGGPSAMEPWRECCTDAGVGVLDPVSAPAEGAPDAI